MAILNLLLTLLITTFFGDLFLSLSTRGAKRLFLFERIALDFPIGLGIIVILMSILGVAHVPLSYSVLLAVILVTIAFLFMINLVLGYYAFKGMGPIAKINWPYKRLDLKAACEIFLFCYVGLKVVLVFFSTLIKPVVDIDAISMYSIVAKAIFIDKGFLSPYIMGSIQDKPLYPYLSQAWIAIGMRTFNDCLIKIVAPVLYLCFAVIIYYAVRRYASRLYSLFFSTLFVTLPFIFYHATTAYADLPQTFYYCAATIYLFLSFKEFGKDEPASNNFLLISFILLGLSIWVKRAGFFLYGINLFVFLTFLSFRLKSISRTHLNRIIVVALISFLIVLPWLFLGRLQAAVLTFQNIQSEIGGATAGGGVAIDKTDIIVRTTAMKLFLYNDWNLIWIAFLFSLILGAGSLIGTQNVYLLGIILLNFLAIFIHLRAGGSFAWLLDGTLFDRLAMNHIPLLLYFISQVLMNYRLEGDRSGEKDKAR